MKTLRRFCGASVLTLTFALFASAGEMSTPLAPPQPALASAPAQGEMSTTFNSEMTTGAPGDMHTTETSADVTLAGVVVDLVQGVLALL